MEVKLSDIGEGFSGQERLNAEKLISSILQPVAREFSFKITSGLRRQATNKVVGGVLGSDHLYGAAADLVPIGHSVEIIFRWMFEQKFPYRQLICSRYKEVNRETGKWTGSWGKWIHVSVNHPAKKFKNETWIESDGKMMEFKGEIWRV